MADFTYSSHGGETAYELEADPDAATASNALTTLTNLSGALVSFALIVGIGVWGYRLVERDVSGIPVVRAMTGDMRVLPEDPGGQLARNTGLSVNEVAADGAAAAPADELRLAPQPTDITAEDQIMPDTRVATEQQGAAQQAPANAEHALIPDVAAALQAGEVEDLVAQLTAGVAPLSAQTTETEGATVTQASASADPITAAIAQVLDAPGVRQSLRPRKRPIRASTVENGAADVVAATAAQPREVDAASLPVGTRLAQLGAFDSEEVAREQWDQMSQRFSVYLSDKQRVIQRATSGGRVFYRLRALGFEDIADARRFCSALVAENADCIPVVTR